MQKKEKKEKKAYEAPRLMFPALKVKENLTFSKIKPPQPFTKIEPPRPRLFC